MNLIDLIKNKIKFKNKRAFGMNYDKFCEVEKNCCDNDSFSDKALDKFARRNTNYPTKEEFEEHIRQIQQNELHSDRFTKIKIFVNDYYKRENKKLEKKLFKIIGTYGLEDHLINKSFDEKRISKIKRYIELKNFINSLTQDQINSNLYLRAVSIFMETSIEDCEFIIRRLKEKIEDLELSDENQRLELNINIPIKRLKLLPTTICEQVGIPYYRPQDYKIAYINVLDEENSHIYSEYNIYVRNINKLATDIYQLQMWNLLSIYPEQIYNYYFYILNNDSEHEFRTAYFVKKYREKNDAEIENKPYQLSEKTKENISKAIGLPFDEIVNMDFEDLEKNIEQRIEKKPTYDLRLRIDGIPIDEEHIITIEQVDKKLDKTTNGPKLVLRIKNNNDSK